MRFDKAAYEEYNTPGIQVIVNWLNFNGVYTRVKEDFGVDIRAAKIIGGSVFHTLHEIEVRPMWTKEIFPFSTVTIPIRKRKLIEESEHKLFFWSISANYKNAIFVSGDIVRTCDLDEKDTTRGVEVFFSVPIEKYTPIKLVI